jgi:hypothetical protein
MAVTLVTEPVNEYTCDGCGKSSIATESEDPPKGITGNVFEVTDFGGDGGDFWACSRKCLRAAVFTTLDRGSR